MRFVSLFSSVLAALAVGLSTASCQFALLSVGKIDSLVPGGGGESLALSGHQLYLANYNDGLRIYDISDPSNPVNIAHRTNSGSAFQVVVSENYAYVANGTDGLRIYDVSNPTNPFSIGHAGVGATALVLAGNCAYVIDDQIGLDVLDAFAVTNPAAPILIASTGPLDWPTYSPLSSVDASGGFVYVTAGSYGLLVYAATNLVSPVYRSTNALSGFGFANWVDVSRGLAYVAVQGSSLDPGLWIYSITNPAAPCLVGSTGIAASAVCVVGNYAYVASQHGLQIFEVAVPSQPIAVAETKLSPQRGVAVSGDYVYVASGDEGVQIFRLMPVIHFSSWSPNSVTLAWPQTVAQFVLQQCSDLDRVDWTTVTNAPVLQSGVYQSVLPRSSGNQFYRLLPVRAGLPTGLAGSPKN